MKGNPLIGMQYLGRGFSALKAPGLRRYVVLPLPLMLWHRLGIRVLLFLLFLDGYRLHRLLADPKKLLLMRAALAQHS